jgi:flagellar hook-associated protein 3 FlgL
MIDMTGSMLNHLTNLNIENERISYQMGSGRLLQNGSDDSVIYAQVIDIKHNQRIYNGLKEQIEKTTAQNRISDTTMNEIESVINLIKADLMKSLNEGMGASIKGVIATNILGFRESLISMSNTKINGEYIFAGSDTTKQAFAKNTNFNMNGKVDFKGNTILKKIAVEPGTYRHRGITGFDLLMYNKSTAGAGEQLTFTENERIIDASQQEWKLNENKDKIQQYDKNGTLVDPAVEIGVINDGAIPPTYTTAEAITGTQFLKAKHSYFDDLNVMVNTLKGYSTNSDGTKGSSINNDQMKITLRTLLDNTLKQLDASNIGHAELGGRSNIFNISLERISTKSAHYNILMQKVGGTDVSKLAMESKSLEMTYSALYSTVSKMYSLSLLNYIK